MPRDGESVRYFPSLGLIGWRTTVPLGLVGRSTYPRGVFARSFRQELSPRVFAGFVIDCNKPKTDEKSVHRFVVRADTTSTLRSKQMKSTKTLIVGSLSAAALAVGIVAASAQSGPQGNVAPALTPEQQAAVRAVIKDRLADEFRERVAERLSDVAATLNTLTPDQRAALRSMIKERIAVEVREGLADRLAERLGDARATGPGTEPGTGPGTLSPDQRAAVRAVIKDRLADELRERVADRLSDAAATLNTLTPEQRAALRGLIRARVAAEVRQGLADRLADRLADVRATGPDTGPGSGIGPGLSPDQRAAVRAIIRERLAEELRERVGEDLADAAGAMNTLTPEQRVAIRN